MGNGRFVNGKLNFVASASYVLSAAEKSAWRTCLSDASDYLFRATGGQVQIGDVYLTDNNFALVDADVVFHQGNATSGGSRGEFGRPNVWVRLYTVDRPNHRVLVHELSHHVWNLGDEYSSPMTSFQIDKSTPAPDRRTIPILNGPPANSLAGHLVFIRFGSDDVRERIQSNTATRIVATADFPNLPTNSNIDSGFLQDTTVSCGSPAVTGTTFCIMEDKSANVTEYCQPNNHDTIQNTDQHALHNESCWETIISTPGFQPLIVPAASPANPPAAVNFIDLVTENRFVIAFDRSGSMSGDKLAYAKEGVKYWIDNCALADDHLCVIGYNSNNNILLPLSQVSTVPSLTTLKNDVEAVTTTGQTNIRDAIREGVAQITSRPNPAVAQAVILLTDGKHNRPAGSSLLEAQPDLAASNSKVLAVALGDGNGVDADDLDTIAHDSGGFMTLVALDNPIDVETALVEANLFLRGGLADSTTFDFVPAPAAQKRAKPLTDALYARGRTPGFVELMRSLRVRNRIPASPKAFNPFAELFSTRTVHIEQGCERATFSINYELRGDFDLFLFDPTGTPIDFTAPGVTKVAGAKSHKFVMVNKPRSGDWTILVFARKFPSGGRPTEVNLSVGAENRKLIVSAGATKSVYLTGEDLRLYAGASWGSRLSGLAVSASIRSGDGSSFAFPMTDGGALAATSGEYVAEIPHLKPGRYAGVISIAGKARSPRAGILHELTHSDAASLDNRATNPRFERVQPIRFEILKKR